MATCRNVSISVHKRRIYGVTNANASSRRRGRQALGRDVLGVVLDEPGPRLWLCTHNGRIAAGRRRRYML